MILRSCTALVENRECFYGDGMSHDTMLVHDYGVPEYSTKEVDDDSHERVRLTLPYTLSSGNTVHTLEHWDGRLEERT